MPVVFDKIVYAESAVETKPNNDDWREGTCEPGEPKRLDQEQNDQDSA
jgi:hypothetical protein